MYSFAEYDNCICLEEEVTTDFNTMAEWLERPLVLSMIAVNKMLGLNTENYWVKGYFPLFVLGQQVLGEKLVPDFGILQMLIGVQC